MSMGARKRTYGCSPRAPGWFRQNHLGGVISACVCACFLSEMEFCLTKASLCSRGVFRREDWIETELY